MFEWLGSNAVGLGGLVAASALIWSAVQFMLVRARDQRTRDFEAYHRLIKELVSPDDSSGLTRVDRQTAIVFELRHFPRYYEVTQRILLVLRRNWTSTPDMPWGHLIEEIDLTLDYMRSPRRWLNRVRATRSQSERG
jgi:hypothetical protein